MNSPPERSPVPVERDGLVVQCRMGFSDIDLMRRGLRAVRDSGLPTVGTITLDSFTRTNQHARARSALAEGRTLNGYPIVAHGARRTRELLADVAGPGFGIQMRHGSARPFEIFEVMLDAGITVTEGGPVSYCLPYSRVPLDVATEEWERSCALLGAYQGHVETFGGCLLGQLCPPDLLVAISVLEALFFQHNGIRDVSLSYAQQVHFGQDLEALLALRELASSYLAADVGWHVVVYTYMGVYPASRRGALGLLAESARLAAAAGCERVIVKTVAEATRIPTIEENVAALRHAHDAALAQRDRPPAPAGTGIEERARALIDTVLGLADTVGGALVRAFRGGVLDVPYCLHPDNANVARSGIDERGRLIWADPGAMPISHLVPRARAQRVTSAELLRMLAHVRRRFDTDAPATAEGV
ncbi:methylaspartate mutase [Prauserella marina]|uniref:Methylaspartate mutase epsilon subunit n=1 Tax=Prauserella marina TaxID=530584 RepID=A0A222VRJ8_9PSEU|nr:methylaspartate mutase [Prauserella marina]ASR36538.1 methylaspartate mutase [Prauserella marina]PWV73932.1 glutamate mutase subunit E [Prauserella marina]SDD59250.1 methylaspartate mutase epsilon subunit [Prauserella marina]